MFTNNYHKLSNFKFRKIKKKKSHFINLSNAMHEILTSAFIDFEHIDLPFTILQVSFKLKL